MFRPTLLLATLLAACSATPNGDAMTPNQTTSAALLAMSVGSYAGPNLLWFMDPETPLESDGTIEVEADRLAYTWSYEGKPQTGVLTLDIGDDGITAELTDSWHTAGAPMAFTGEHVADAIVVNGTYSAGQGPDWGWRIELRAPEPGTFRIEMFNIQPDGVEQIAVRLVGTPR